MPTPELEPWKEWDGERMGEELPPRSSRLGIAYGRPRVGIDRGVGW